ncbi:Uncharacterised protein [Mycobacteroides abscessus subsp. abscessus]|nr:Uncharacterised protein [Mycobacteroides abscessus subsp. abscessus]
MSRSSGRSEKPSALMWCMTSTSRLLRSSRVSRVARNGISAVTSNHVLASSTTRRGASDARW